MRQARLRTPKNLCGGTFGKGRDKAPVFPQKCMRDRDVLEAPKQAVCHLGEVAALVVAAEGGQRTPGAVVVQEDEMPCGWIQAQVPKDEVAMCESRFMETCSLLGEDADQFGHIPRLVPEIRPRDLQGREDVIRIALEPSSGGENWHRAGETGGQQFL